MKRKVFLAFTLTLFIFIANGQDSIYLKQKAIRVDKQDSLGDDIYKVISDYQLLMIGEMHGTNESARFVMSLAELFIKKGCFVQIGLEIPSEQMKKYLSSPTDNNIYSSDFFTNRCYDARACFAWADLIAKLHDNHNVEIFFYDINAGDTKNIDDRDRLMYLKIKKRIQLHPTWKTITLSGNIHTMLLPYNGKTKMALYLRDDKALNMANKILPIVHIYATGTIWDNSDNSLRLYQVDHAGSLFAKTVDYENYLFLYPQYVKMTYGGVYFTRKITASNLVSKK
jgi:hypothetical protein